MIRRLLALIRRRPAVEGKGPPCGPSGVYVSAAVAQALREGRVVVVTRGGER